MQKLITSKLRASAARRIKGVKFAGKVEKQNTKESENQTIEKSIR